MRDDLKTWLQEMRELTRADLDDGIQILLDTGFVVGTMEADCENGLENSADLEEAWQLANAIRKEFKEIWA